MQLELSAEQVSALMSRMPAEAIGLDSGFSYADGHLTVPENWQAEAQAIMAEPGWEASATRDALLRYAADRRWRLETGGIEVAGVTVATDRGSQAMVAGAHAYLTQAREATIRFKALTGFVTLDAEAVTAVALAVGAHVQACFAIEADVLEAIEAGTITTTAAIDAAFA